LGKQSLLPGKVSRYFLLSDQKKVTKEKSPAAAKQPELFERNSRKKKLGFASNRFFALMNAFSESFFGCFA